MAETFELHDYYRRVGYDGSVGPFQSLDRARAAAHDRLSGSVSLDHVAIRSRQTDKVLEKVYRDHTEVLHGS